MITVEDYCGGALIKTKPEDSPDWHRSTLYASMRQVQYNVLAKSLRPMPESCNTAFLVRHEDGTYAGYWDKEIIVCVTREADEEV